MKRWNDKEINDLINLNNKILYKKDIEKIFTSRSLMSILKRSKKIGVKISIKYQRYNKWSDVDIKILKNKYLLDKKSLMNLFPNRTWSSIQNQLSKLKLIRRNRKWENEDIEYLKNNYNLTNKNDMINHLKRTWASISLKSISLNLNRNNDIYRYSSMKNLLIDNCESFYWIGFLLADGHFNNNICRIRLTLSNIDVDHIIKFSKFIECDNININDKYCSISFQNTNQFNTITEKFNINNRKTYNPVDFELFKKFEKTHVFSIIVGFIDGDGSIQNHRHRNDCSLSIHLHSSWLKNLIYIEDFIYEYFNIEKNKTLSKIGNDGYSRLVLSNNNILNEMKKECVKLNLPVLERKWNKINENKYPKSIIFEEHKKNIIKLYDNGKTPMEIVKLLNLKQGIVYKYIREQKIKILK